MPNKNKSISGYLKELVPNLKVFSIGQLRSKDKIGYEINFTKYFYKYQPLRSLEEIKADILGLEQETEGLLKEILVS
ncbi:MAG: hypothetical protein JSV31_30850 [Desulfobacterales bacterium]|nr:MAG: hypothetical protein JSV31_30850 [Desulfobacterales bacterium]